MRTCLLPLVLALGTATAAGPARQTITFNRVFPNAGQIGLFIAASDGSGERPLLAIPGVDYDATWSPDGAWIVFTSERAGSADLYRLPVEGGEPERLTDHPAYDDQAAFSPDGRRLVFVSSRQDGTADLHLLDLGSRRVTALTSGPGGDFRPAWSPDGEWIAFSSDRHSTLPLAHGRWEYLHVVDLYVVRPDGSGLRRLGTRQDFCGSPRWSEDSRRLLASCMTAEQTLANRRPAPEAGSESRLAWVDVASGAVSPVESGAGVKMNPTPLRTGDIAFIRKDGGAATAGIHYVSGARGPRGDVRTAAWSPDGRRVVFHRRLPMAIPPWTPMATQAPGYELVMTAGQLASFSPSGDRYVTNRRPLGNRLGAGLLIADAAAETMTLLYEDEARNVLAPQWSPRGDRIVFGLGEYNAFFNGFNGRFLAPEERAETGAQVAIINVDGTGFRELTAGRSNNGFPSFAPDGRRIVYRTFGTDGEGLRIMDVETGGISVLTQGYDNFPLWSPRGDEIIFCRRVDGDYEIFSVRPDGTALTRLTRSPGNDAHMAWSPDADWIAFASSRRGFKDEVLYTDAPQPYGDLFVMRRDGTRLVQLTDNQWEDGAPTWRPAAPPSNQR